MAKVWIDMSPDEAKVVTALLQVRRGLKTRFAKITLHHTDGVTKDITVEERVRIDDMPDSST